MLLELSAFSLRGIFVLMKNKVCLLSVEDERALTGDDDHDASRWVTVPRRLQNGVKTSLTHLVLLWKDPTR